MSSGCADGCYSQNGGTQSLEQPSDSAVAKGLLHALGVERNGSTTTTMRRCTRGWVMACSSMRRPSARNVSSTASGSVRGRKVLRGGAVRAGSSSQPHAPVYRKVDDLPGRSVESKRALLAHTSYAMFLVEIAQLGSSCAAVLSNVDERFGGVGIDAVPALDIYESGDDYGMYVYPGFRGMDLGNGAGYWTKPRGEPYIFHFPDGNASIARLLVRAVVPGRSAATRWKTS